MFTPKAPSARQIRRQATRELRCQRRKQVVAAAAAVAAFGGTMGALAGSTAAAATGGPTVASAADPQGGGWTVTASGAVSAYGGAPTFGDASATSLSQPIVGMASTTGGDGYWLVAADGGIFSYGDARFYGSTGNITLTKPIVGMSATADGGGYWLVAADGGIFSYGDARFYGSTGNITLTKPIVGMSASPDGRGYWLVAADGGIFSYGDARFYGSTGNITLTKPIVGMSTATNGGGYRLVAADGGIFSFGTAPFYGSLSGRSLPAPVTAVDSLSDGYAIVDGAGDVNVLPTGSMSSVYHRRAPATSSTTTAPTTAASTTTSTTTSTAAAPTTSTTTPAPSTTTSTTAASATPQAAVAGGINFGGIFEQQFNQMTAAEQAATMNQVASLGITWIRVDVPFCAVEQTPGSFNWYPDTEIRLAQADGIHVDALIDYSPSWADVSNGSPDPTAFGQFAEAAATNLQALGVSTYEIMNEPNLPGNWDSVGTVSPAGYTAVLKASYTAIKAVQPTSTVITAGLSPAVDSASTLSPATFLAQIYANGGKGYFDAVGAHPYSFPDMPTQPDSWNQFSTGLPAMRAAMVANGDAAKKIWLTEYGAPTAGNGAVSTATQAAMITSAFSVAASQSWIGPIFLYNWKDDATDNSDSFGLYTINGAPKPAAAAVQQALRP